MRINPMCSVQSRVHIFRKVVRMLTDSPNAFKAEKSMSKDDLDNAEAEALANFKTSSPSSVDLLGDVIRDCMRMREEKEMEALKGWAVDQGRYYNSVPSGFWEGPYIAQEFRCLWLERTLNGRMAGLEDSMHVSGSY